MDLLRDLRDLAAFVRARLVDVGELLTPAVLRPDEMPGAARQVAAVTATAIVSAAAPFAPTSYARARLLRQLHASGLLTQDETERATELLSIAR